MQALCNGSGAHSSHMNKLKRSRKELGECTDAAAIALSGNAAFDAEMQSNFSKMIQQGLEKMGKTGVRHGLSKDTASSQNVLQPTMVSGVTHSEPAAAMPVMSSADTKVPSHPQLASGASSRKPRSKDESPMPNLPAIPAQQSLMSASKRHTVSHAATLTSKVVDGHSLPSGDSTGSSSAGTNKRPKRSTCRSWQCQRCTFLNKTHTWPTARCEVCQTTRNSANTGNGDVTVHVLEC